MVIFYLLSFLLICKFSQANVNFDITNNDGGPIWIGIQGNPGHPHLRNGGFVLNKGQTNTVSAPDNWAGRFWSRTWCNAQTKHCLTGDCGNKLQCNGAGGNPPATLVEIALKVHAGLDYYDISLVDGWNSKATISPINGKRDNGPNSCKNLKCNAQLTGSCPGELQVKNPQGAPIACKSACAAFNTPQYCCTGAHNTAATCKSSSWPKNYPKYFKDNCPDAYSYAYDDHKSLVTCKAQAYKITFG